MQNNTIEIGAELGALIETKIRNPRKELGITFSVPVATTAHCIFCGCDVAPITFDGGEFNAEIVEVNGARRVEVTTPHICAEGERWRQFHEAPTEDRE